MAKEQILPTRIGFKHQRPKSTKTPREELRFQNSLLRFRECLLDQMKKKFDRVLSRKLDAVDFFLSSGKKDGKK